ncbi:MAG: DUF624 domain-containing protein [Coprococcus sp.]
MKKLNIDNPFFDFMGLLADIVITNLLFILCSVPIITMGASMSAMYQTFREMKEETFISVFRSFKRTFKGSLKKSLPAWLFQLLTGILLVFDLTFIVKAGNTVFWHISGMILGCLFLLWAMVSAWLIPAGIYENGKLAEALKKSLYLAIGNLPYTIVMVILNSIPGICLILGDFFTALLMPVYLAAGFGVSAYLNSILLGKCKGV